MSTQLLRIHPTSLGATFATIDLVLHPLFHLWVAVSPHSYEHLMNLFVAGLRLKVTEFDTSWGHVILGSVIEACIFWLLGFLGGTIYNYFVSRKETPQTSIK